MIGLREMAFRRGASRERPYSTRGIDPPEVTQSRIFESERCAAENGWGRRARLEPGQLAGLTARRRLS
jgi:hypothetical protein